MAKKVHMIFLVDDDEATNYFNLIMIESAKIAEETFVHDNGMDALKMLKDSHERGTALPDLIFLDINMPVMNGWAFLEEVKALGPQIVSKLKVIMLSASDNPTDVERSKQFPFVKGYISKPLNVDKIQGLFQKK